MFKVITRRSHSSHEKEQKKAKEKKKRFNFCKDFATTIASEKSRFDEDTAFYKQFNSVEDRLIRKPVFGVSKTVHFLKKNKWENEGYL